MNIASFSDWRLKQFGLYDTLAFGDRVWSSETEHGYTAKLARGLIDQGLRPSERVVILLPNCAEHALTTTSVLRAGGTCVSLVPNTPTEELARIIAACEPAAIVAAPDLIARVAAVGSSLRLRLTTGAAEGWLNLDRLADASPLLESVVERADGDVAFLFYSSGTTGAPKGVMYTHGAIAAFAERHAHARPTRVDENAAAAPLTTRLVVLPLAHAIGARGLLEGLWQKRRTVILDQSDPRVILATLQKERVNHVAVVPTLLAVLTAAAEGETFDLSSLRSVDTGGAPTWPALLDAFEARFRIRPRSMFGMSEHWWVCAPTAERGATGRLFDGVEMRILSPEGLQLAPGEVGEVIVRSPWSSAGYYKDPEQTAQTFRNGWIHTGDLGRVDGDGFFFHLGRRKDIIIQGGVNVYPLEVIRAVSDLPGVADCAVVGLPNEVLGEEVVVCIVKAKGPALTAEAVLAHCRQRLDDRKAPVKVEFLDALPKTPVGKTKVQALRESLLKARATVTESALITELAHLPGAQRMERMRREVLSVVVPLLRTKGDAIAESPSSTVPFGELGLDSIGAVSLAQALAGMLKRPLPPTVVFRHPTVDRLAAHLLNEAFPTQEQRIAARQKSHDTGAVAVIGMACRFPGNADTPDRFWDLLCRQVETTTEIPPQRWKAEQYYDPTPGTPGKLYTKHAAFLADADGFDAEFFGLTPREALELDPAQRILLELTWQALEDAGYRPPELAGSTTAFYVGIGRSSYPSVGLDVSAPMAAGRVRQFLDLLGPTFALDTTCSSSLVATHLAIQSLRRHECDLAIVAGTHVICSPDDFATSTRLRALSPDGRCKTFDAGADGFGFGEGCGVIVLQRYDDASGRGSRVLGLIRGSAINSEGRSSSLTAPNGVAHEAVMRAALRDADVLPTDIDFLETHGTGTALGDPIEIQASAKVLGEGRDAERRLLAGAVKTNIGHLNQAAGIAGLIKTLLALRHRQIPANLHLKHLNPMLEPYTRTIAFPIELSPWPQPAGRPPLAMVCAKGMSGTNAAIVVERAPDAPAPAAKADASARAEPRVLCLSGRSEAALQELARRHGERLRLMGEEDLDDACFTVNAARAPFPHRLAVVANDAVTMSAQLLAFGEGKGSRARQSHVTARQRTAFLFTGQGSQCLGMGRQLYEREPVFREAIDRCTDLTGTALPRPLAKILYEVDAPNRSGELTIDDTALAQPAIFAVEWALSALWRSWGIEPDVLLGYSLGEYVAACVSGLLDLESGLRLAVERGRLMQALPQAGSMVAVSTHAARVEVAIGALRDRVSIAAMSGPSATVISGESDAVTSVAQALAAQGIDTRTLRVSHAFHSHLMDPILDEFERVASQLRFSEPRVKMIPSLTGGPVGFAELATARYWRRHVREPVRFAQAVQMLAADGCELFLEIGSSPVLLGMGRACVPEAGRRFRWLPSLRRDRPDLEQMLDSLADAHLAGHDVDWRVFHRSRPARLIDMPTYAFHHRRYWKTGPGLVGATTAARTAPEEEATTGTPSNRRAAPWLEAPETQRQVLIVSALQQALGGVLGVAPEQLSPEKSLLEHGLDSLRVLDCLETVRETFGVVVPREGFFISPTVGGLAALVGKLLIPRQSAAPSASESAGQLVPLRSGGSQPPLFCIHPSGGQISSYLRLTGLLDPDQPVYGIQASGERDEPTLEAMAQAYADLICGEPLRGPHRLLGWSMGGVVAQAIAGELERRGREVSIVALIDPPWPQAGTAMPALGVAVAGALLELFPACTLSDRQLATLRELDGWIERPADEWVAFCGQHQLVEPGAPTARLIELIQVRLRHMRLVQGHTVRPCRAPLALFWGAAGRNDAWRAPPTSIALDLVVGGNHFSLVSSPHIETIARRLSETLRGCTEAA